MPFCFVDLETSGLDPYLHDITECAAILIDDNYKINAKNNFHKRFSIQNLDSVDDDALEIGHYNQSIWDKTSVSAEKGMLEFNQWLKDVSPSDTPIMVATNAEFDKSFLLSHADRFKVHLHIGVSFIDLIALWIVYKHKKNLMHLGNGQDKIISYFEISNVKAHMALSDALSGAMAFSKLMKACLFK